MKWELSEVRGEHRDAKVDNVRAVKLSAEADAMG